MFFGIRAGGGGTLELTDTSVPWDWGRMTEHVCMLVRIHIPPPPPPPKVYWGGGGGGRKREGAGHSKRAGGVCEGAGIDVCTTS